MRVRLYQVAVRHPGLNAYRVISGTDWYAVNAKARAQFDAWESEFRDRQARDPRRSPPQGDPDERRAAGVRRSERWAAEQSAEARRALEAVRDTLRRATLVDSAVDWEALVDRSEFAKPPPEPPYVEPPPDVPSPGDAPDASDPKYSPDLGVLGRLSTARREARVAEAEARLAADRQRWADAVTAARAARADATVRYEEAVRHARTQHRARVVEWERERSSFLAERARRNAELAERRRRYEDGEPDAVVAYCHMVLARSEYPDAWPREVTVEYDAERRTAVVDMTLPPPDLMPDVRAVTFDAATGRFAALRLSTAERVALHESVLYALPIRTAHELVEADRADKIESVAFNGWLRGRDAGDDRDRCVVSLVVDRAMIRSLDLAAIDPKACFRAIGGVGWSEHYNVDPVTPIVPSEQVRAGDAPSPRATASMYGSLGLEEMSAEDFEHLTRELVEREIATDGERVSMARVIGGADALVIAAPPARNVRVLVHARRSARACSPDAVRALREAARIERASEAVFISSDDADDAARIVAEELSVALVDGPRLLNLLARNAGRLGLDLRGTASIPADTAELERPA